MKSIGLQTKHEVVRLFLQGYSYDDIVLKKDVSKGAVAGIVEEFREGELPLLPGDAEIIDSLRKVAVDLRKLGITPQLAQVSAPVAKKLKEMGAGAGDAAKWVELCHAMASPSVSNQEFMPAAFELAELVQDWGMNCAQILSTFEIKEQLLEKLSESIKTGEERKKTIEGDIIQMDAQRVAKEKELADFMQQNNLDWDMVNTACALLENMAGDKLSPGNVKKLQALLIKTSSIMGAIDNLKSAKEQAELEYQQQEDFKRVMENSIQLVVKTHQEIVGTIFAKTKEKAGLEVKIAELHQTVEQNEVVLKNQKTAMLEQEDAIIIGRLVTALLGGGGLTSKELEEICSLMFYLYYMRTGVPPTEIKEKDGHFFAWCRIFAIATPLPDNATKLEEIREKLALLLVPFINDKFVTVWKNKDDVLDAELSGMKWGLNHGVGTK